MKALLSENNTSVRSLGDFKPSCTWPSFEKFRTQGPGALKSIGSGKYGSLVVKGDEYRILKGYDFQYLWALATEVERLRQGLKVVVCVAKVIERHPEDQESIDALKAAVAMIVQTPELPTREDFQVIEPEGIQLDPSDEVELDNIPRPVFHP